MADSGLDTPETIARRLKMAELLMDQAKPQPITHWTQGLAQMLNAGLGGYEYNKALEAEKKGQLAQNGARMSMLGLGTPAVSGVAGALSAAPTAPNASPVQEVSPDQFNSIDAMASPAGKFDPNYQATLGAANRAVAGIESGGNYGARGPVITSGAMAGDQAIGKHQVMGRNVGPWTKDVLGTEMTPSQFAANPDAQDTVFNAKFGADMQKYGNVTDPASKWFTGRPLAEGANRSDQLGTTGANYAGKVAAALNQPAAAPQPTQGQTVQQPVQPPLPQNDEQASTKAQIAKMLSDPNPYVRKQGATLADAFIQKHMIKDGPEYGKLDDGRLFDKHSGKVVSTGSPPYRPIVDPAERAKFGIGPDDKSPYQVDTSTGKATPVNTAPTTNVALNTALKGKEAMATHIAKTFDDVQMAGREASKRTQIWNEMEQASKGFTPGATANVKLEAKRFLKDAGLIAGEDVPDAEVFKMMQQQLAIHNQPKGQGAVSNYEREMFAKSIPNMTMSPEALQRAIGISRGLDDFDKSVAKIYRDSARAHDGVPDPVEVNEQIEKLGSPVTPKDRNWMQNLTKTASSSVDPAALAEAKKRGLVP